MDFISLIHFFNNDAIVFGRNFLSHSSHLRFHDDSSMSTTSLLGRSLPSQPTQTSLRRLQDVLNRSRRLTTKQDVVMTSGKWRPIYDVLKTSDLRCLEDVQVTTSWRRLIYDVFRASDFQRPEDVWFTSSWRSPICDVLKTSDLRCLEDVQFTTSWRRLTYDVFKTPIKRHL